MKTYFRSWQLKLHLWRARSPTCVGLDDLLVVVAAVCLRLGITNPAKAGFRALWSRGISRQLTFLRTRPRHLCALLHFGTVRARS